MKKVVTVTLGPSEQDFSFKTKFLGQQFEVTRLGADDDTTQAWELMRRHQADADAIGLGEIGDRHAEFGAEGPDLAADGDLEDIVARTAERMGVLSAVLSRARSSFVGHHVPARLRTASIPTRPPPNSSAASRRQVRQ